MKLNEIKIVEEFRSQNVDFNKVKPEIEIALKKLYSKLKTLGVEFANRRIEDDIYLDPVHGNKKMAQITFAGRNYDLYTSRPGEEDDDHPNANSKLKPFFEKAEAAAKSVFPNAKIGVQGGEKSSVYTTIDLPIDDIFKNELKLESKINDFPDDAESVKIRKDWDELSRMGRAALEAEYKRSHKVSNTKGVDKGTLISALMYSKYHEKKIKKAFGLL